MVNELIFPQHNEKDAKNRYWKIIVPNTKKSLQPMRSEKLVKVHYRCAITLIGLHELVGLRRHFGRDNTRRGLSISDEEYKSRTPEFCP
jgi:hypothetical protein